MTDALSTGADLSKVYENNLVDLKSIRNEFQNSRGILVNYTLGALLKFGLSTLLLVGLCLAVFETLITCDSSLNCTFINYIYCPFAKVLCKLLLFDYYTRLLKFSSRWSLRALSHTLNSTFTWLYLWAAWTRSISSARCTTFYGCRLPRCENSVAFLSNTRRASEKFQPIGNGILRGLTKC